MNPLERVVVWLAVYGFVFASVLWMAVPRELWREWRDARRAWWRGVVKRHICDQYPDDWGTMP